MKPFLKSVAEYLTENFADNMYSLAVVFPNKRARLFFTVYLSEIAEKPLFSPQFYTITEYIQKIAGETIADQLTLLFNLYETYIDITQSKESFDDFLFYCEMILSDFDDIDKYRADAKMLFQNLSELKELEAFTDYLDENQLKAIRQFWETFNTSRNSEEKQRFGSIWQILYKIYAQFKLQLTQKGIAFEGMAYKNAIDNIEKNNIGLPGEKVAFVGFSALNKCEEKLFKILKDRNQALYFWDYDDYYLKRKSFHEAAYFLGGLVMKFPAPGGFAFETNLISNDKKINIIDIPTKIGQTKALPEIIEELPAGWKNNPVKTALALADETLLLPALTALPNNIGEINISMGYPVKETLIYSLISILIDLHKNKRVKSDGAEQFYYSDVTRVLQHGLFVSKYSTETSAFIANSIKKNLIYIDSKNIGLTALPLGFIFKPRINSLNFIPYLISLLDETLKLSNKNKLGLHEIEKEAAATIINQLRRMDDILKSSNIRFSFNSLLRLIEKLLRPLSVPFTGEPLSGLQVMGILETRLLDFDNIIILSMNEGTFPKSGNVPTLIPYTLRKAFELPTIEHQDAIFAYYFYRLLQRSSNITLVYCSSANDNQSGEPSRFIRQLIFDDSFKKDKQTLIYSIFPENERKITGKKTEETRRLLQNRFSNDNSKPLTPSAINTYLNCQLRFYFAYIAKIPEPEEMMEEVESNIFGSILHKAMQILYRPFENKTALKTDIEQLKKKQDFVEKTIEKAFFEEYFEPGKEYAGDQSIEFKGKNLIVKAVINQYIKQILQYDLNMAPMSITGLEKLFAYDFIIFNDLKISVGGIIDRIEQYGEKIRIVDYKTGKVKNTFLSVEDLFQQNSENRNEAAFQIILYSLVISKMYNDVSIIPNLYYVREMTSDNYSASLLTGEKSKISVDDVLPYLAEFEILLLQTLEEIYAKNGSFEQTTNEKLCNYCPYKSICGK